MKDANRPLNHSGMIERESNHSGMMMNESKQIEVYDKKTCDDRTKYLNILEMQMHYLQTRALVAWQTYMRVKTGILIAELKSRHPSPDSDKESGSGTAPQTPVLKEQMANRFRLRSRIVTENTFTKTVTRMPRDLWKQRNSFDIWTIKPHDEWEVSSAEYMLKVALDRDKFTYTDYCTFLYIHNWLPSRSGELFPWSDESSVRRLGKLYFFQSVLENQERCLYGILKGIDTAHSPVLNSRAGRLKLSQLEFVASQKIERPEDLRLRNEMVEENSMLRTEESLQTTESEIKHESQFLNKFKSIKIIGRGGYGCVYEAETTLIGGLDWKCAVKRILLRKRDMREALREVETLIALDHHGIVKFYDAWTEYPPPEISEYLIDSAFLYIQMELCQSTLSKWLVENDTRDLVRMIFWFKQIVCAVQYIHEMGRIHRDLKPSNILFSAPDRLKLCDLGIATDRAIVEGGEEVVKSRTCEKGTRMYMAPEQMGFVRYSSKVDIFALGLIFAEMCAVMTIDEAAEVFNNYRARKLNTILDHFPEAKRFVAWLTNYDDTKRPDCEEILKHPYICDTIPHPMTFLDSTPAIPLILRAQINPRKKDRDHTRHRQPSFNNRPKCCLQQPHSRNLSFPRK